MRDKLIYILLFLSLLSCNKKSQDCYCNNKDFSFSISDGFISEYNSNKEIFKLEFPLDSVTNIFLTLSEREMHQIKQILCKYDFVNLEIDNERRTKTNTVISGPNYRFSLKVNCKNMSKEIVLDNKVVYNNSSKNNEKFKELWGEIWDIIVNKKKIKEKMPNF
jgi:hypothetical protein